VKIASVGPSLAMLESYARRVVSVKACKR
jgi:hypothetical protein